MLSSCNEIKCFLTSANLQSHAKKGKITKDKLETVLSLLQGVLEYDSFKDVDLVIEVNSSKKCLLLFFFNLENYMINKFKYREQHKLYESQLKF